MRDIRISVIITSYNQKDYLKKTVDSVINQTVQPYEIIIADDHSTDGSVELIKQYMENHPHLVKAVFQSQNVGIPKNRNSACQVVSGNFVSILDGDDLFFPYTIEKEIEALQTNPNANCVYSNISYIDSEGDLIGSRDQNACPSGNIFELIAANGKGGLLRSMVIDYSMMKEAGFMNESLPKYDGLELTAKLSKMCVFVYIHTPLVQKREHAASDSKNLKAKEHLHDLRIISGTMSELSVDLPKQTRRKIRSTWQRRIFKWYLRSQYQKLRDVLNPTVSKA